jgi:ssDNA-binding Zn-finger/Zn-ribbon topoisomerase 1
MIKPCVPLQVAFGHVHNGLITGKDTALYPKCNMGKFITQPIGINRYRGHSVANINSKQNDIIISTNEQEGKTFHDFNCCIKLNDISYQAPIRINESTTHIRHLLS